MAQAKVVLLANDINGLKVTRYLVKRGDLIQRLYVHSAKFQKSSDEIIKSSGLDKSKIFFDKDLKDPQHINGLKKLNPDYIISVHWKWLLSDDVLSVPNKGNVNFHPALLPVGRGWYPHVFSFINGSPTGVTIHQMDGGMDTGPIWAQKKVDIQPLDTSKEIYLRLQNEIYNLFRKTWPKIVSGKITPVAQSTNGAISYSISEVSTLDEIDLEKEMKVKDVINLLRARSFGSMGFANYKIGEEKVYLNLRLNSNPNFRKIK